MIFLTLRKNSNNYLHIRNPDVSMSFVLGKFQKLKILSQGIENWWKLFRREREIGANYFGFRISETENFPQGTENKLFRKPK